MIGRREHELGDPRARLDRYLVAHVETALDDGYDLLVGDEIAALADDFGVPLARYFEPTP